MQTERKYASFITMKTVPRLEEERERRDVLE